MMKEKKNILLAAQDKDLLEQFKDLLETNNYNVTVTETGKQAHLAFSSKFFDVVISEEALPGMDGLELLKKVKTIDDDSVFIFLADTLDEIKLRKALKRGAANIFLKPYTYEELCEAVTAVDNRRKENRDIRRYKVEMERYIDDTTEMLKLQKEALEHEQERSQGIIREAHFGIVFLDGDTEEVFMLNKKGKDLFHLKKEFENIFFSKNFRAIFPDKVVERIEEAVKRVKQEKAVIDVGEFVDEDVILNYSAYPVMIDRDVSSIVIIADDVTEKKVMERQLLQSTRLAGIGELAAGVAHEINNPVAFVMSNTRMLEKYFSRIHQVLRKYEEIEKDFLGEKEESHRKKKLKEISDLKEKLKIEKAIKNIEEILKENIDGLERVKKIVFDLKTFSHMDKIEMEEADINKIMTDTLNLVWNELKYKSEVVQDLGGIPAIQCFPQQISQVFANVLVNAVHAIEGKGIINIKTYLKNNKVFIEISDTGCGMSEETKKKIFNPFFTTKESDRGTGLGLSIVFRIIEKHNGTIDVESEIQKGTKFIIALNVDQKREKKED